MPNIKNIYDLPVHVEGGDILEVAVADYRGVIHRVDKTKAVYLTEAEAIARIREIANQGKGFFILPYDPKP